MPDGEFPARAGRVILIMGPSSAGKTTLAAALQKSLTGLWLVAGVDLFWGALREETLPAGDFRSDSESMRRFTRGWHRAVAALSREGNSVIVDELWVHRWWLDDWSDVLAGTQWWSVLLKADSATLDAREEQRGDRPRGLGRSDASVSPGGDGFDLVLDTDRTTISECVAAIEGLLL